MAAITRKRVDALVIGAGAAGLAAARDLSQAGLTVTAVEARDRVGGRIYTLRDRNAPLPIELGAEFVHGEAEETFQIIRAAQLVVAELPDTRYRSRNGKLSALGGFWDTVQEVQRGIAGRMKRSGNSDFSFADYLERANLSSDVRQMLIDFVEGYHAAHVDKVSARYLMVGDDEIGDDAGNKQFRIVSGGDGVVQWLRSGLDPERTTLRLNTVAIGLTWRAGDVTLRCATRTGAVLEPFHARTAIVAVPHAVLRANALPFDPDLPAKRRAVELLQVGHVFKIVLRFRESFWEKGGFVTQRLEEPRDDPAEPTFILAHDVEVPTWWTALPARVPVLTGWAGGPKAETLLAMAEPERVERTLTALSQAFAVPRGVVDDLLESWAMHDWQADPFSRGAYTYPGVGGVPAQTALAMPVNATLFLAGEATDPEQTATVAGAIASGRRAAREVISALARGR